MFKIKMITCISKYPGTTLSAHPFIDHLAHKQTTSKLQHKNTLFIRSPWLPGRKAIKMYDTE